MKVVGVALLILVFFSECKKDKTTQLSCACPGNKCWTTGIILDEGVGPDGCGWHVVADICFGSPSGWEAIVDYIPDNLPPEFEKDSLQVYVNFNLEADSEICGFAGRKFPVMNILAIQKQ